jgi:hypothetical protein
LADLPLNPSLSLLQKIVRDSKSDFDFKGDFLEKKFFGARSVVSTRTRQSAAAAHGAMGAAATTTAGAAAAAAAAARNKTMTTVGKSRGRQATASSAVTVPNVNPPTANAHVGGDAMDESD